MKFHGISCGEFAVVELLEWLWLEAAVHGF
jgi:hypothetical protein